MGARHVIVHGKVQGVFYRDWTVSTARTYSLTGWVRNLPDGTVEALIEGEQATIDAMIAAMHKGPPRAQVDRIDSEAAEPEGLTGFKRR